MELKAHSKRKQQFFKKPKFSEIRKGVFSELEDFHEKGKKCLEKYGPKGTKHGGFEKEKRGKFAEGRWKSFKTPYFFYFVNQKCPICGENINSSDPIDHYRPKKIYYWLAYDYSNFILLCSHCNSIDKKDKFPLFRNQEEPFLEMELKKEQPLLINPLYDNPVHHFFLIFWDRPDPNRELSRMTIHPNPSLEKDSYEFQKAQTTIETYHLNPKRNGGKRKILGEGNPRFFHRKSIENKLFDFAESKIRCSKFFKEKRGGSLGKSNALDGFYLSFSEIECFNWFDLILTNQFDFMPNPLNPELIKKINFKSL